MKMDDADLNENYFDSKNFGEIKKGNDTRNTGKLAAKEMLKDMSKEIMKIESKFENTIKKMDMMKNYYNTVISKESINFSARDEIESSLEQKKSVSSTRNNVESKVSEKLFGVINSKNNIFAREPSITEETMRKPKINVTISPRNSQRKSLDSSQSDSYRSQNRLSQRIKQSQKSLSKTFSCDSRDSFASTSTTEISEMLWQRQEFKETPPFYSDNSDGGKSLFLKFGSTSLKDEFESIKDNLKKLSSHSSLSRDFNGGIKKKKLDSKKTVRKRSKIDEKNMKKKENSDSMRRKSDKSRSETKSVGKSRKKKKSDRMTETDVQAENKNIVEIYHNNDLKIDSISTLSNTRNLPLKFESVPQKNQNSSKNEAQKSRMNPMENVDAFRSEKKLKQISSMKCEIIKEENEEKLEQEKKKTETKYCDRETYCCTSVTVKSYELPTEVSKLRQVDRSCFKRYHSKSIPFVVATSTGPSYNIGLNIQKVLGLIKATNVVKNDITCSLMREVSQGIKPISSLLKDLDLAEKSENCALPNFGLSLWNFTISNQKKILEPLNMDCLQNMYYNKWINESVLLQNNKSSNILRPSMSSKNIKITENRIRVEESEKNLSKARPSSIEIKNLLVKLHDQFEDLITQIEKTKVQAEKTTDVKIERKLKILEKEANEKEKEIQVVAHLYKEVATLKNQMTMLTSRSDLIFITAGVQKNPQTANSNPKKISLPPVMRLAFLLREIQTVQKRLELRI